MIYKAATRQIHAHCTAQDMYHFLQMPSICLAALNKISVCKDSVVCGGVHTELQTQFRIK